MKAKYSDGVSKNFFRPHSATNAMQENAIPVDIGYESGDLKYLYRWNWGKIPYLISDYEISGVACGKDGKVYAACRFTDHPILEFDKCGKFLRYIDVEQDVGRIHGISVDKDGNIWYSDLYNHVCCKVSPEGKTLMMLGNYEQPSDTGADLYTDLGNLRHLTVKKAAGPFNMPTKIVEGPDGCLYAADGYCNSAIHKFSPNGELLKSWGAPGSGDGEFRVIHGIAVDSENRIWAADRENRRVQVFNCEGQLIKIIDNLMYPQDVAADGDYVYIAEHDSRITVCSKELEIVAQIGSGDGEFHPHSIAVDENGSLFISQIMLYHHLSKFEKG